VTPKFKKIYIIIKKKKPKTRDGDKDCDGKEFQVLGTCDLSEVEHTPRGGDASGQHCVDWNSLKTKNSSNFEVSKMKAYNRLRKVVIGREPGRVVWKLAKFSLRIKKIQNIQRLKNFLTKTKTKNNIIYLRKKKYFSRLTTKACQQPKVVHRRMKAE
jgi:hypothetical protein